MMTEKVKNKIQLPVPAKKHIKTKKVFCIIKKGIFLSLPIISVFCQLLLYQLFYIIVNFVDVLF